MTSSIRLVFFVCSALAFLGCAAAPDDDRDPVEEVTSVDQAVKGGNKGWCAIKCAGPPDGCHYEGAVTTGPCHKLTCGTLVCDGSPL